MITSRCEVSGSHLYTSFIFAIIPSSINISRKKFVFTDFGHCNNNDFTFIRPLDETWGGGVEGWRVRGLLRGGRMQLDADKNLNGKQRIEHDHSGKSSAMFFE
jgi:hypothetical protein